MQLHDAARQGQTETDAEPALAAAASVRSLYEHLEHVADLRGRHADAAIGHGHHDLRRFEPRADGPWPAAYALAWEARGHGVARDVLVGHTAEVGSLAFLAGARRVVTAGHDHTLRVWDLHDRRVRVLTGHTDNVVFVTVARGGADGRGHHAALLPQHREGVEPRH